MSEETLAILGGSFNPPHIAHFRLGHEAMDNLKISELIFMPCPNPPHKTEGNLLPFALRCKLLRAYTDPIPHFSVSDLENELPAPSYTVQTLRKMHSLRPNANFIFIMGAEDLEFFHTWHEWEEIIKLADILVFPRSCGFSEEIFEGLIKKLNSNFQKTDVGLPAKATAFKLKDSKKIIYFPQPILEISSSLIRERWRREESLDLFLPEKVLSILKKHRPIANSFWKKIK